MASIKVTYCHNQPLKLGNIIFAANAVTDIDLFTWISLKETYDPIYECFGSGDRQLETDEAEVSRLLLKFREECISKFEAIGEASIRASISQNGISSKPELLLAHEWLESKIVAREDEAIAIAKEAKSAALDQARWAKWAAIIATVSAIIAVAAIYRSF